MLLLATALSTMIIDGQICTSPDRHTWTCQVSVPSYPRLDGLARKMGNANAVAECGIRSAAWYSATSRRLSQAIWNATSNMDKQQRKEANGYVARIARKQEAWILGGQGMRGCRDLAKMPFVHSDAAFAP